LTARSVLLTKYQQTVRIASFEIPDVVPTRSVGRPALLIGLVWMSLATVFLPAALSRRAFAQTSNLKQDQDVVFYPALAYPVGSNQWEIQIHGCVFEPEKRVIPIALLRELLALDHIHFSAAENKLFKERARLFMIDEKGGRRIVIRLGERTYKLGKSEANGQFVGTLHFTEEEIKKVRQSATNFHIVLKPKDTRQFTGEIHFVDEAGQIVISDIDDTIKVTSVGDRHAMLRNTFIQPFKAVDGMPELYRGWAATNRAEFFYVSASPWQLYAPLAEFIRDAGFPAGAFFLKTVDLKDKTFFALFQTPDQYKPGVIEPLMKRFPHRKFVLVGDSGEQDPEIYAALARKFPEQINRIFIRDLSGGAEEERFRKAFQGLAPELWKTFREPSELSTVPP
jgi:phosphatidate phosphatase APP1